MTVGAREGEDDMRGNAMVALWFLIIYCKTTAANTSLHGRKYFPPTRIIYVLYTSAYLRPRYDVCLNSLQYPLKAYNNSNTPWYCVDSLVL